MTQLIWEEFSQQLLGFIKARVGSVEEAEDLLQDIFIKIHRNLPKVKDSNRMAAWVYQITRNAIADHYRKKGVARAVPELPDTVPDEAEEQPLDFTRCLRPFINKLPEKYKDALEKVTYQNISQKDYALLHNISHSAAKSRVQRARQQLAALIRECCEIETDRYGQILAVGSECSCQCQ